VYYTQVQYLRRVKGGKSGPVIPTREKALFVRLERERVGILKALS
jgi:predicted ribosome quality control (RQC) complex YloA/Tae2 family protein